MPAGKFIVFEGIDGSGLTTQAELLKNWFLKRGEECYLTKEPSEGPVGAIIRLVLTKRIVCQANEQYKPLDEFSLALLFAADRVDHLHNLILPRLTIGVNVISDRYYLSSFAYQSLQVDLPWLISINSKCKKPGLTIFLDVPVEICKKRMERQRWHVELYEDNKKLEQVRENYHHTIKELSCQGEPIMIVDGTGTVQDVHRLVVQVVKSIFLSKPTVADKNQLGLDLLSKEVTKAKINFEKEDKNG